MKGAMLERRDAGKDVFRNGWIEERRDAGKEGFKKGWICERMDAGKEGFKKGGDAGTGWRPLSSLVPPLTLCLALWLIPMVSLVLNVAGVNSLAPTRLRS